MQRWWLAAALCAAPLQAQPATSWVADGQSVRCINQRQLSGSEVLDDQTIVFRSGRKVWHNRLPVACPNLGFEGSFRQFNATAGLCEGDLITPVNRGAGPRESPTCALGRFQPMKEVPAAPAG